MMPGPVQAGIDEAGRGPLAGPVLAAAVVLDPERPIEGLADSKKLTAKRRETLYMIIMADAAGVGVGISQRSEIDRINILQATLAAMQRAVDNLPFRPGHLMIDGQGLVLDHPSQETIVRGDATVPSISAASIVAKVTRDRIMADYHKIYPAYGFDQHKGYGTPEHLAALAEFGACPIHRQSFSPVARHLPNWQQLREPGKMGILGEQLAGTYLIEQGHQILDWRYNVPHTGELDLVAKDGEETVFVEVKSQVPGDWGPAEFQVDRRKRDRIMAAAQHYCGEKGIDSDLRFDVISVTFTKAGPEIRHMKSGLNAD